MILEVKSLPFNLDFYFILTFAGPFTFPEFSVQGHLPQPLHFVSETVTFQFSHYMLHHGEPFDTAS